MSRYYYVCVNPDNPGEHCNRRHTTSTAAKNCRNRLRHASRQLLGEYVCFESVAMTAAELAVLPQTQLQPALLAALAAEDDRQRTKPRLSVPREPAGGEVGRSASADRDGGFGHNHDRGYVSDSQYHGDQFGRGEW